jgi:predicted anti-sigma-YlaC factor YlaD
MRIPCNVIKDLLLLYENGEASEETKNLVEEHLKDCDECRVFLHSDSLNLTPLQEQEVLSENQKEAKEIKKLLTKVKRRWKLSIVSALMILPILLFSVLTFDEFTGSGIERID